MQRSDIATSWSSNWTAAEGCECFHHALNLSLSHCSDAKAIRNCCNVIIFQYVCEDKFRIEDYFEVAPCGSVWDERHVAVIKFLSELPNGVASLEHISMWKDASSTTTARMLLSVFRCFALSCRCVVVDADHQSVLAERIGKFVSGCDSYRQRVGSF